MADITDIQIAFGTEEQAIKAEEIARTMIKLVYAIDEKDPPAWAADVRRCETLAEAYLRYGAAAEDYDPVRNFAYCAILRVHREGKELMIDRCGDLVRGFQLQGCFAFFPQLCAACALRFPDLSFEAHCRYEMTVSALEEFHDVRYDGAVFRTEYRCILEDDEGAPDRETFSLAPNGLLQKVL